MGWIDHSVVNATVCSCRGPEFNSPHSRCHGDLYLQLWGLQHLWAPQAAALTCTSSSTDTHAHMYTCNLFKVSLRKYTLLNHSDPLHHKNFLLKTTSITKRKGSRLLMGSHISRVEAEQARTSWRLEICADF